MSDNPNAAKTTEQASIAISLVGKILPIVPLIIAATKGISIIRPIMSSVDIRLSF